MKKLLATLAVVASVAGAVIAGGPVESNFQNFGAAVLNFGNGQGGRVTCGITCQSGPCVTGAVLSLRITPSGNAGLGCTNGTWLLAKPDPPGLAGGLSCGFYGSGPFRVTPSGVANGFCNNN